VRIGFLVFNLAGMGGTSRSAITQANALAGRHDVRLVSVTRSADAAHYAIDPRVAVDYLVDVRDESAPALAGVDADRARAWHARPSLLVPPRWDAQFSALCDVAMERHLPGLDLDVLVTVTPGLLVAAEHLVGDSVALVHQEHRSSSDRVSGLEPLLTDGQRADVVALLTESTATWLADRLGAAAPPLVVVPNPLPQGFVPRSRLDAPVIVAAGRLAGEKQFGHLVRAFAAIADDLPEWRLRIFGVGTARNLIQAATRKAGLYDRVEVPGVSGDMPGEWAKASISALTSKAEGYPLVLQEAMAAGVPVVSYDCPSGPREIITHEVDGLLVAPGSEAGLATALLRLASDPALRTRLGDAAAARARAWDAAEIALRWEQIFADALAEHADAGVRRLGRRHATAPVGTPTHGVGVDPGPATGWATPAQARRQGLAVATTAADEATQEWFVVPPVRGAPSVVVVPTADRARFLQALAAGQTPDYLSLRDPGDHGWPERRGPVADLATALTRAMTPRVVVEPWPETASGPSVLGQGCGVEVQFWDETVTGELVAPVPNPFVARVPRRAATATRRVEGLDLPTLPLMTAPVVGETTVPIDVVYTWVDGGDPVWFEHQQARLAQWTGRSSAGASSSGRARFESRDELRYSMRSLHLFAPWVRTIHVVTAGQVPPWLDVDHPQIRLVDHREILPAEALPTFNSHAIETALHLVPDVAEHFVYFNDDVLLGRPVPPELFFDSAGRSSVFTSPHLVGLGGPDHAADPAYVTAALHNRRLLADAFGVGLTHHLAHTPHPQRVSVLAEVSVRFADAVAATARAPFRSATDVSMLSSLAPTYGLLTGSAVEADIESAFVDLSNTMAGTQLQQLARRRQDVICIGDHHDYALEMGRVDRLLAAFLAAYYPIAAPWERG
jgi:glycosyltransferase involved in cell wall biosynthesis